YGAACYLLRPSPVARHLALRIGAGNDSASTLHLGGGQHLIRRQSLFLRERENRGRWLVTPYRLPHHRVSPLTLDENTALPLYELRPHSIEGRAIPAYRFRYDAGRPS